MLHLKDQPTNSKDNGEQRDGHKKSISNPNQKVFSPTIEEND